MSSIARVEPAGEPPSPCDLVLVGRFEGQDPDLEALWPPIRSGVGEILGRPSWAGRNGQTQELATGIETAPRLAVVGLGKASRFSRQRLESWIRSTGEWAAASGATRLLVQLPAHEIVDGEGGLQSLARHLALTGYAYDRLRDASNDGPRIERVELRTALGAEAETRIEVGRVVAAAVARACDLANTPPNLATPGWMAEQASALAAERGLDLEVLEGEELEARRMGGLLAVGGGSAHSPCLVRLTWRGGGNRSVALVGKGVTFDTGGISIKPAAGMEEMKYDKCGACAVLGALDAVSRLRLPLTVHGYLALAENMPSGTAYRPGDIVRCYNGKTVEVVNTDAEGRMILADALTWAAESGPQALVELSTLTGACVVALGQSGAGLYSPDDELAEALSQAAQRSGERLWRMPLWEEFSTALEGLHSDLKNVGGRWGGANIAAAFLGHFVGETASWAHLDIAGPAYREAKPGRSGGATGYGVALLTEWLRSTSA